MIYFFITVILLFIQGGYHGTLGYILPLTYRVTRKSDSVLRSSPNIFSGFKPTNRDDDDDDDDEKQNRRERMRNKSGKGPQKRIEFVNFWGTKWTINEDGSESPDPRKIPSSRYLDPRDGPLPPGSYVMEGKSEFDAKSTCRISIAVKSESNDIMDDPDQVVRRLQACVDSGLDTFQLQDQTSRSLDIVKKMNDETPSYVQKHWSIRMKIPKLSLESSIKSEVRFSVLDLIEQTGSDALDSLQVDCSSLQADEHNAALEVFEYLVELQEEGWISSIGLRDNESTKLQRDINAYFGDHIDFEQREGNLLVPPNYSQLWTPDTKLRISNGLAGDLLTDRHLNDNYRTQRHRNNNPKPFLSKTDVGVLREWESRWREQKPSESDVLIWNLYQEHVVNQIHWIATKHDVSMTAIALRWALECSAGNENIECEPFASSTKDPPIISTVVADVVFDSPSELPFRAPEHLRQVFRFELDEEDKQILSDIAATKQSWTPDENDDSEDGDGYPDIDFNNPTIWL